MELFLPAACEPGVYRKTFLTSSVLRAHVQETPTMNTDSQGDIGVVFRKTLGHYSVRTQGREIDCVLSSLIHKQLIYPTADPTSLRHTVRGVREIEHVDPIALGDRVRYMDAGDGRDMIPLTSLNSKKA